MKKIISAFLALAIAFSCAALFAFGADAAGEGLIVSVSPETPEDGKLETVKWVKTEGGEYFFFIPSYWNADSLKVSFSGAAEASLNGKKIENGSVYNLGSGGKITAGGADYKYTLLSSSGIGTVFINTESGSLDSVHADKSYKEEGTVAIYDSEGNNQCSNDKLDYIKGRGNQTWEYDKKPYNIKLNKKVSVLGMKKSKKWCLIANYSDASLSRNSIIYGAAADAGMEFTPEYSPVDLFINNEYKGSYLITSKIEVDENRIDLENLDDANEDACVEKFGEDFDMDTLKKGGTYGTFAGLLENTYKYVEVPEDENTSKGGYVIEMELANRYFDEIGGFVTSRSQPFIMKSPEYASKSQVEFVRDFYQRFEDAVYSKDDKNAAGEYYYNLADMKSLAEYYIISEWSSNMDSGLTSTYFYIDNTKDSKLYAGPVWDYDIALGNNDSKRFGCDYTNPEEYTVCFSRMYRNTVFGRVDAEAKTTVYNELTNKSGFIKECKKYWDENMYSVFKDWSEKKASAYIRLITDSAVMDHILWNNYGTSDAKTVKEKFEKDAGDTVRFISKRTEFMNGTIGNVQNNPHDIGFIDSIRMKLLTFANNMFEKMIVTFKLENKVFGFYEG